MKILLACQQSPHTYAIPAYGFWRTYFVEGLREAGHEIIEVAGADWARGLLPLSRSELAGWREETWTRTLATARQNPGIDLFLGYLYPQQIETSGVKALRAAGIPTVNFFCDNLREYRRLPAAFSPFDLHWVPEFAALPLYGARGWRALFAPMPCWVPAALRVSPGAERPLVTFVGRRDSLRAELLAAVARDGLPLAIHGRGWSHESAPPPPPPRPSWPARFADWTDYFQRQGFGPTWRRLTQSRAAPSPAEKFDFAPWVQPSPSDDAYPRVLAESAVTLGINRYPEPGGTAATYSRLRDIEAPMLGACYLTEWAPELPLLYELGVEIETYHNEAELTAKSRMLLADAPRRLALRQEGQRRALDHHGVGPTLRKIARTLGLKPTVA